MSPHREHERRLLHIWRQGFRRAGHPIHSLEEIKKILIVKPSALGDVIHGLPVLSVLRENFPEAHIAWLVKKEFAGVLASCPALDRIITWDRGRWRTVREGWQSLTEFWRFIKAMELTGFDLVIDLQGLFRSGLMAYGTGAPVRVGFSTARELSHKFYNVKVDPPSIDVHAVDRYLFVADRLHLEAAPPRFDLGVDEQARRNVLERLGACKDDGRPLVAVAASTQWPTKEWPAKRFADVADGLISSFNARIVLVGTPPERPHADTVRYHMRGDAVNAAGDTTLPELVALIDEADLFLTNDSGPMHIADALGTPLVAVFGPTDPVRTGPYRQRRNVVLPRDCECAPCLRRYCTDRHCMHGIPADAVLRMAEKLLNGRANA